MEISKNVSSLDVVTSVTKDSQIDQEDEIGQVMNILLSQLNNS
jgi:hypothetical protein